MSQYQVESNQTTKRSMASCLLCRARTVAIGENVEKEVKHVTEVLKADGHPVHTIRLAQRHEKREQ